MPEIHPSAIVSPEAQLGENVVIGPGAVIEPDVIIGNGSSIGPHAVIASGARLGADVRIFSGAVIATEPQDLKFEGEYTTVEIGDRTVIREYATINRGTKDRLSTKVGHDCLIMSYTHLAHDCWVGNHVILSNAVNLAGHITIEDHAIIGGMVPVHQFVRIGAHCFIGGGYRVPRDVPPFILASGEPMDFTGLNRVGLLRRGFTEEQLKPMREAYKILYRSDLNTTQALDEIPNSVEITAEVEQIMEFVRSAKRGIIKG